MIYFFYCFFFLFAMLSRLTLLSRKLKIEVNRIWSLRPLAVGYTLLLVLFLLNYDWLDLLLLIMCRNKAPILIIRVDVHVGSSRVESSQGRVLFNPNTRLFLFDLEPELIYVRVDLNLGQVIWVVVLNNVISYYIYRDKKNLLHVVNFGHAYKHNYKSKNIKRWLKLIDKPKQRKIYI